MIRLSYLLLMAMLLNLSASAQQQVTQHYNWKSVQIRGGGFVDGIIYHPTKKGLLYCRTDMGGAYKWNNITNTWEALLDWVSYKDDNLMGVESIALDPNDTNRLYMACGTYTGSHGPNAILVSANQGKIFKQVDVPFRMGGNENGRGNGERMAVDPNNGNIIYMGTRLDGLWKSDDRGSNWHQVGGISSSMLSPDTSTKFWSRLSGIIFVLFDGKVKIDNKTAVIYMGISQQGRESLYKSMDGGSKWLPVPGQPTNLMPTHAVLSADGMLYITYGNSPGPSGMTDGAVYQFNTKSGQWKNISPIKPDPENGKGFGYAAVTIDAQHPQTIMVSTFHRYGKAVGDDIFRSTDAGNSWKPIFTGDVKGKYDDSAAPYVSHTGIHWLFDLEIDPTNTNHAIFTTGYGLHETYDLTNVDMGNPTIWTVKNTGIEETVALDLLSPPVGAQLISAIGDYGGFVHNDLDEPAPEGNFINPHFSNTTGVSCGAQNSNTIVRVGEGSTQVGGGNIGYSLDGGKEWHPTQNAPFTGSRSGSISVSADGHSWIWTPQNNIPYITSNKGNSWQPVSGLPMNTRVVADQVNPAKFYAMALFDGELYTSIDSGKTFQQQNLSLAGGLPERTRNRGDVRGGQDRIYTVPSKEGQLWIAAFDGLYRNTGKINKFQKIAHVSEVHAFGFGKGAPQSEYPALYVAETIDGMDGIFRSDDEGKNWVRINDDQHRWGLILQITGDPKKYGRVYVGTHGRGIFYGDMIQSN